MYMKKVLFLSSDKPQNLVKAVEFADKMKQLLGGDFQIENAQIRDLIFDINGYETKIYHPDKGFDIKDFDLVVFRHVGKNVIEARAAAVYLEKYDVKFTDSYISSLMLDNKIDSSMLHWADGLPVPRTLYGNPEKLAGYLPVLGGKAIFKDIEGNKGKHNYLVSSEVEIRRISAENPEVKFLLQQFIPNDRDYRILVFNFKPVLIIERISGGKTHLNNTSAGGTWRLVDVESFDQKVLDIAAQASRIEKLEVSGADIVIDKNTQKPYILEINRAPQILSAPPEDEKAKEYAAMIRELVKAE